MAQREAEGRSESVDFLQPPRADLEDAAVEGDVARVKVRFLAEFRSRSKGPEGEAVDDRRTAEVWTFERAAGRQGLRLDPGPGRGRRGLRPVAGRRLGRGRLVRRSPARCCSPPAPPSRRRTPPGSRRPAASPRAGPRSAARGRPHRRSRRAVASPRRRKPEPSSARISFASLPGWNQEDHAAALDMFRASCGVEKDAGLARGLRPGARPRPAGRADLPRLLGEQFPRRDRRASRAPKMAC